MGRPYIVMQFVPGETLKALKGTLADREVAEIGRDVAFAIQAAHDRGLLHRDIKPENIILCRDFQPPRPFVMDFGLVKRMASDSAPKTATGLGMGTLAYLSPEQAQGERDKVDCRSDVYLIGSTLYDLLAGSPPFGNIDSVDGILRIIQDTPIHLGVRRPTLPRELATIVMKCLEKEPSQRYASARALGEDLERFLASARIEGRPTTVWYRLRRWVAQHRIVSALGVALAAAVLALMGLWSWGRHAAGERARWAQVFGQEAERIEAMVRYARIQPAHDTTLELDVVRERIAWIAASVRGAGRYGKGPGDYAMGRALIALGDFREALARLEAAKQDGFASDELDYALFKAKGLAYRDAVERAFRMPDPELRKERLAKLDSEAKKGFLVGLRTVATRDPLPVAFDEALKALVDRNMERVVTLADDLAVKRPWLYEATQLKGAALLERARRSPAGVGRVQAMEASLAAFASAARIGASDERLALDEAYAWMDFLPQATDSSAMERRFGRCVAAAERAEVIHPGGALGLAIRARAHALMGMWRADHGGDGRPDMEQAANLAEQVQGSLHGDERALALVADTLVLCGRLELANGRDPRAVLGRAVALASSLLGANPTHSEAGLAGTQAVVLAMAYEGQHGIVPIATWERGRALGERMIATEPDLPFHSAILGYLWGERADYERGHGLDPRPSLEAASVHFERARHLAPANAFILYGLANLNLTWGQFEAGQGMDPTVRLNLAQRAYAEVHALRPTDYSPVFLMGETALTLAERLLPQGRERVAPLLAEADAWLAKALAINPNSVGAKFTLARLRLRQARSGDGEAKGPRIAQAEAIIRDLAAQHQAPDNLRQLRAELRALRNQS